MHNTMDASYDDIQLQVEVPVRVFSAKCNSAISLIYFDYFGKPAQITILAENQDGSSADYQVRRRLLHMLAQNLEPKSNFCMAVKYIPIASQIEVVLKDVMLDSVPSFSTSLSLAGLYPLEWFLSMGRRRFLLTEVGHGKVCVVTESGWPDKSPAMGDLPPLPQNLLSLSTKDLEVNPSRCGKDRICGSINIDLHPTDINAADTYHYTFVCLRDIGACAAFEGSHRAMADQIRQLDLIDGYCQVLSPEERRAVCVPSIRACLFYEFPRHPVPGKLLVGAIFDDLPRLTPLRNFNAPLEVVRKCVLKICKTVEWLADKGIGWGGSVGYPATHKGQALLDAAVVDAFGRPWLMEGFTDIEEKIASDRLAVQLLRGSFDLLEIEQIN
ncbi:hypothetical protein LMH87_004079 [Akanthomyces muscarius]|uniref:Uncharacterized protein n=1 Tax=Akanthomyces muscarius TaxID=2231603 RepID=A0A9W8Q4N5_AKAMU|nr:hypothetical protein LMH87_004079 [Akanthomyces muscarius]KAJ4145224.1 hypothetical protein LMH87_004079 [Akanthomyces muscarius]